ncbi:MAG: hypothetical protein FJX54_19035 [Alphaproteobacteria bacterium]|nr:hypothetical protein [Alphaproteobacteria bacterium]
MNLLSEVETRLMKTRDRLVAALDSSAAGDPVELGDLAQVVDELCRDIVRLPPAQGRPLAEPLGLLIRGLDELENRLRQVQARESRGDALPSHAARAYGRRPES